jgi:hypothetical protein
MKPFPLLPKRKKGKEKHGKGSKRKNTTTNNNYFLKL